MPQCLTDLMPKCCTTAVLYKLYINVIFRYDDDVCPRSDCPALVPRSAHPAGNGFPGPVDADPVQQPRQ